MRSHLLVLPLALVGCLGIGQSFILEIENVGTASGEASVAIWSGDQELESMSISVNPSSTERFNFGRPADSFEIRLTFPSGNTRSAISFEGCGGDLVYHVRVQIDPRAFSLSDGTIRCE